MVYLFNGDAAESSPAAFNVAVVTRSGTLPAVTFNANLRLKSKGIVDELIFCSVAHDTIAIQANNSRILKVLIIFYAQLIGLAIRVLNRIHFFFMLRLFENVLYKKI